MALSRRDTLKLGASALVAQTVTAFPAVAADAKTLGQWYTTRSGMPGYQYLGALPAGARDRSGADAEEAPDPTFILGNYRLTAFAHVSGQVQVLTGERAWARVNAGDEMNSADNRAVLKVGGQSYQLVGLKGLAADPKVSTRRFGPGFARYDYAVNPQLRVRRVVSVKPSADINQGNPTLLISLTFINSGRKSLPFEYEESFRNHYVQASLQRLPVERRPVRYDSIVTTDAAAAVALSKTIATPVIFAVDSQADEAHPFDVKPAHVFMHTRSDDASITGDITSSNDAALTGRFSGILLPGKSVTVHLAYGLTYDTNPAAQITDAFSGAEVKTLDDGLFARAWKSRLPDVTGEKNPVLRTEMPWHAYTLEAMATYTAYFDETFVPQGVIYAYEDGENISNRDNLQALLPLIHTRPALAKSSLRHVFKQTTQTGEIKRGTGGFSYVSPSIYKESDEQIYLFMALGEYLRVTHDFGFLDEIVTYYPADRKKSDSVINVLKRHFVYLRDEVGVGPNGLVRILNSDWSDSFFHDWSPNNTAHAAESHLNSAMALAVLPGLITALQSSGRADCVELITAMETWRAGLSKAYMADLGDRDFSARAYLPDGKPKFGLDVVCLEAQGFLLQMNELPLERKRAVYRRVRAATLDPEKIGFRIREKPIFGGKPEGEDGAIWFALEYQMVLGVLSFDRVEALRLLEVMSFDNYARQYPDYWMGRWTHFDSVQSSLSDREGLLNYWRRSYRQCSYGYCSHPHSWPLYIYLKAQKQQKG